MVLLITCAHLKPFPKLKQIVVPLIREYKLIKVMYHEIKMAVIKARVNEDDQS